MLQKKLGLRRCAVLVMTTVIVSGASSSLADIMYMTVDPADPTEADVITVTVFGEFPNTCYSVDKVDCGLPQDEEISLHVTPAVAQGVCLPVTIGYEHKCQYGPLSRGHYVVAATEYSGPPPEWPFPPPDVVVVEFDVRKIVPVMDTSWGRIRAMYR